MSLFWKREAGNAPATWAEGGPGGGGVSEITSDDASVAITNPTGPTVDLSVSGGGIPDGWTQAGNPADVNAHGGSLTAESGTQSSAVFPTTIGTSDSASGANVFMAPVQGVVSGPEGGASFTADPGAAGATVALDGGGLPVKNLAEGTDPSDAATVSQLGGSLPAWWTVVDDPPSVEFAGLVTVSNPSAEVDDLAVIKIPATYVDDSNRGWLLRAAFDPSDSSTYVFAAGLDKLLFKAAADEGDGSFQIRATDRSASASIGTFGLGLFGEDSTKYIGFASNPTGAIGVFDKATAPVEQQTGVAVTAEAIHAALVAYGWITA